MGPKVTGRRCSRASVGDLHGDIGQAARRAHGELYVGNLGLSQAAGSGGHPDRASEPQRLSTIVSGKSRIGGP